MSDDTSSGPSAGQLHEESSKRWNTTVVVLAVVVVVQALLIVALGVSTAYFWGVQSSMSDLEQDIYGMPTPEEEEQWLRADEIAMEVGYLIKDGEMDEYLQMYEAGDPHVDFAEVEEAFLEAVEKGQGVEDVEYMSDMMMPPVTYEDQGTGETVLRVSVTGVDYATGEPRGGRVTLYVLDEDGDMTLTGKEDRDLKTVSTFY